MITERRACATDNAVHGLEPPRAAPSKSDKDTRYQSMLFTARGISDYLDPRAYRTFVFGTKESRFLGHLAATCAGMVLDNVEFAIPPFERTYIEYEARPAFNELGSKDFYRNIRLDDRIGCAIDTTRSVVYPLVRSDNTHPSGELGVLCYKKRPGPWPVPSTLAYGTSLIDHDGTKRPLPQEDILRLANGYYPHPFRSTDLVRKVQTTWTHATVELLVLWAALLLLNRPGRIVTTEHVPATSGLHKGKRRVFAAHHRVVLGDLSRVRSVSTEMGLDERNGPRRHEVRGHFVHYGLVAGCEHEWEPFEHGKIAQDGGKRWGCLKCHGRRTWRKSFHRGDASKGFVTKEYAVGEDA